MVSARVIFCVACIMLAVTAENSLSREEDQFQEPQKVEVEARRVEAVRRSKLPPIQIGLLPVSLAPPHVTE